MTGLQIVYVRCEYRDNPIGLDTRKPRFSWLLSSDSRHALQSAYRIQAADRADFSETTLLIWDTQKLESDRSVLIAYEGEPLKARSRYYYRVKVWDQEGHESDWSEIAFWEMGLLGLDDWTADWITPDASVIDPYADAVFLMRKDFTVREAVRNARLYVTSLGLYELELNGLRVGNAEYTPGWTSYKYRLQVQTYDVAGLLCEGNGNAIGASLANGWYKGYLGWKQQRNLYGDTRALLLQLYIDYEDGTTEVIRTDGSWKSNTGPIRLSELYHGETYDARMEQFDWSCHGLDDTKWAAVSLVSHTKDKLIMQESELVRITQRIKPVSVWKTPAGETVLDMGQNMVGRLHFRVEAPAGTQITLQHVEVLDQAGNIYSGNLRTAKQTVQYTCKGGGEESYEPHFSFQGFRYVKLEGWPGEPSLDAFAGHVIHTDMEPTGTFECSHPLLNQLQSNIVWGQRGNFLDVPTDCPQRDERLGWTGDAQVFIRTAAFNFGVAPFFTKWLRDLKADQREDGSVPFVIPHVLGETDYGSAAWGDAAVVCPWTVYLCYGDKQVLEEQYDSMKAWVDYVRSEGEDPYLWNNGFHFGDWLGLDAKEGSYIGATPKDLIATCFFAYSTSLLVKAAKVLGYSEDAERYGHVYEQIVGAFANEFITPSGRLAAHTQTAYVLPLIFGLVDAPVKERLARTLVDYVEEQDGHLTTGFVGTPYLSHALTDHGYHDLAVRLVQQEDYPSWLYAIHQGATTIWEHWDGIKPDGSFWSDRMNSYNHYAYGSIGDWLYRAVAGLDMDETEPAYKRILFRPRPDSGLDYAKASYQSVYGKIRSEWYKTGGGLATYEFEVPPNTTATALLRGLKLEAVRVNGELVSEAAGVIEAGEQEEMLQLRLGSGSYRISQLHTSDAERD